MRHFIWAVLFLTCTVLTTASVDADAASKPTGKELVDKVLDSDPWGLAGAEIRARAIVESDKGEKREMQFSARSRRHQAPLSKSIVRFIAPADLAGTSFLQVQKSDGDDDRYLFLPELKRSRRIAGKTRKNSFMGTDFSYADMDRRDLRDSVADNVGAEKLGKYDVWKVVAKPNGSEAVYGKIEVWVRQDNFVPLKWMMYSASGTLLKTMTAEEVKRIDGRWFITKSLMVSHQDKRQTRLILDQVKPTDSIPDDEFTVRTLEKI
jgi:hypothetical protein